MFRFVVTFIFFRVKCYHTNLFVGWILSQQPMVVAAAPKTQAHFSSSLRKRLKLSVGREYCRFTSCSHNSELAHLMEFSSFGTFEYGSVFAKCFSQMYAHAKPPFKLHQSAKVNWLPYALCVCITFWHEAWKKLYMAVICFFLFCVTEVSELKTVERWSKCLIFDCAKRFCYKSERKKKSSSHA